MKKWCADNKCSLHVNDFTRTILHFEAHCDFPTGHSGLHMLLIFVFLCCAFDPLLLSACFFSPKRKALYRGWFKGADTTAVAKFLQYKYDVVVRENSVHKEYTTCILNALRSGNAFLSRLFRANLFMGKAETAELASFGRQLLDHYIAAANLSYKLGRARFKLIPKLRMFCHVVMHLEYGSTTREWSLSPCVYMCQQDEDLTRRTSAISRTCSIRKVHERTLRKYLVTVQVNLQATASGKRKPLSTRHEEPLKKRSR